MNICVICLRTDKKLNIFDFKLSNFHDEFTDYTMSYIIKPQYCLECEHMLRKVYNFREKCMKANKILANRKKSKMDLDQFYTLLPQTGLGIWQENKARIYDCYEDGFIPQNKSEQTREDNLQPIRMDNMKPMRKDKGQPMIQDKSQPKKQGNTQPMIQDKPQLMLTINGGVLQNVLKTTRKAVGIDFKKANNLPDSIVKENEIFIESESHNVQIGPHDPPMNEEEIKTDEIYDFEMTDVLMDNLEHVLNEVDVINEGETLNSKSFDEIATQNMVDKFQNDSCPDVSLQTSLNNTDNYNSDAVVLNDGYKRRKIEEYRSVTKTEALNVEINSNIVLKEHDYVLEKCTADEKKLQLELDERYNRDKEYESVFQLLYLNTKEERLEEFERRKTYKPYIRAEFKCEICYSWFPFKKFLETHMKRHDVSAGEFLCTICNTRLKNRKLLNQHVCGHKTVYKCKLCTFITNGRSKMVDHYRRHKGLRYECKNCHLTFRWLSLYNVHMTRACALQNRTVCAFCGNTFQNEHGLRFHLTLKHKNAPPIKEAEGVRCAQCAVTFLSEAVYEKHRWAMHSDTMPSSARRKRNRDVNRRRRKPNYTCRVCNEKGSSNGWLKLHFNMYHPTVSMYDLYLDKAIYLCDLCGKGYSSAHGFRVHMLIHSGERPFPCGECPARFRTPAGRDEHAQRHGAPRWSCEYCGKMFGSYGNLYTHKRTHIGNRCFKCPVCGKGFLHHWSMREHVRGVHDNVKRVKKRKATTGTEPKKAVEMLLNGSD